MHMYLSICRYDIGTPQQEMESGVYETFVHDIDVRREGRLEGKVYAYYEMGCTIEDIADKTGMTVAEVEEILSNKQ